MTIHGEPRLHIQLLGRPCWRSTDGRGGEIKKKQALLLAYVAAHGDVPRDTVASRLWDGHVGALHQALHTQRRQFGRDAMELKDGLRLCPDVHCDLLEDLASWSTDVLLERSIFLDGVTAPPELEAWMDAKREDWLSRICTLLLLREEALRAGNQLQQALRLVRRMNELAPRNEVGWRARMWLDFLSGDVTAAERAHDMLLAGLQAGRSPSGESQSLWRVVQAGVRAPMPTGDSPALRWPPRLIGRQKQWAAMNDAALLGEPFLIRGEGGIGLSRLLGAFFSQLGPSIIVKALRGDREAPYATLASLLRELDEQYDLRPSAADRTTLSAVLPQWRSRAEAAMTDSLGLQSAVQRLLVRAAEEGVRCVGIDDLHEADAASLGLIRALAERPPAQLLQFGFAARPTFSAAAQMHIESWRCSRPALKVVDVPPLTSVEVAELLSTLALVGAPATVPAKTLHDEVGGNPSTLLQTLREMPQSWELGQPLPRTDTVRAALEGRLRHVPERARPLLYLAAVLGPDIAHAARALGHPAHEIELWRTDLEVHQVLSNNRFIHEAMREAVLASIPREEYLHWHALAAQALQHDVRVPRARIAMHWAAAERWRQAGMAYREAAQQADNAGQAAEARGLYAQAVACLKRGDALSEEFDALYESLPSELLLDDVRPAQNLVDRLGVLAAASEQVARVAVAQALLAVSHYPRGDAALGATSRALVATEAFADLHGNVMGLHAAALSQAGQLEAAFAASAQALAWAEASNQPRRAREIASHRLYVCWELSRVTDALTLCRDLMDSFEDVGDKAGAAAMEGHLALLLLGVDAGSAVGPARSAVQRHRAIDPSATGPMAVMHRVALASAGVHVGAFDLALTALHERDQPISVGMLPGIRAKAQLALAHVWLLLGDEDAAMAALDKDDADWPPAMQVQRCWALARAARLNGREGAGHLKRMGLVQAAQGQAPLAHTAWLEWSRQGDARRVADQMRWIEQEYESAGMPGAARAAALRRIDRLGELADDGSIAEAGQLAQQVFNQLVAGAGLHASVYLPEAWLTLSRALTRSESRESACSAWALGRRWIEETALPNVPPPWRERFLQRNLTNRILLTDA